MSLLHSYLSATVNVVNKARDTATNSMDQYLLVQHELGSHVFNLDDEMDTLYLQVPCLTMSLYQTAIEYEQTFLAS